MNAPLRTALALSALFHALVCVWVEVRGKKSETAVAITPDRFAGSGIDVEALPVERETKTPSAATAPAAAVPAEAKSPAADEATDAVPTERPRKPRIPRKPPAPPPPLSNTDRLSARAAASAASATGSASAAEGASATAARPSGSAGMASPAAGSEASPAAASAAYGAEGLPPGVRHLPRAFTRALALANRGDTRWREVAAGRVGEAHLRLAVDAEGQLGELEYASDAERDRLAPVVKKLFSNTLLLLKNGRFSVDPRTLSAGVTRLRVLVEVVDGGPPSAEGDPVELFGLASAAPEPGKPGKSGFVLNSGRQITAWVWIE